VAAVFIVCLAVVLILLYPFESDCRSRVEAASSHRNVLAPHEAKEIILSIIKIHGLPYPTGITLVDLYHYRKWKKEVYDPHAAGETLAVFNSDPVRRQSIINAARDAFKRAFGDCCCTR